MHTSFCCTLWPHAWMSLWVLKCPFPPHSLCLCCAFSFRAVLEGQGKGSEPPTLPKHSPCTGLEPECQLSSSGTPAKASVVLSRASCWLVFALTGDQLWAHQPQYIAGQMALWELIMCTRTQGGLSHIYTGLHAWL